MYISFDKLMNEILFGGLSLVLNFLKIIIPIIIILEILIHYKLIEKISKKFTFLEKILGIKKDAILPLLIGYIIGITYAAGAIKTINDQGNISKRDLSLIAIFLFSCHGVLETTILLGANGANVFYILVVRTVIAIVITAVFSRTVFRQKK